MIAGLVEDQERRKESLEARAQAVVTSSGALVSLLFGLVAVVTSGDGFSLPRAAGGPLYMSILAFAGAALLALGVSVPLRYRNWDPGGLRSMLYLSRWAEPLLTGQRRVAATRIDVFEQACRLNSIKSWLLTAALAFEVGAVVLLGVSALEILMHR